MRSFLFILALALAPQARAFDQNHSEWTNILQTFTNPKGVNYQLLAKSENQLKQYLASLETISDSEFNAWPAIQQKAFLINAYNAFTISLILANDKNGSLKSIKDIGGWFSSPWKQDFFKLLSGKITNLDTIEHEYLRTRYKDPRIHAAVNCASVSCPKLRREAYTPAKIDAQLDEQMRDWLADSTKNRYDSAKGQLHLSKIFDWFGEDFDTWGGVKAVVAKFGPPDAQAALQKKGEIDFLPYNWGLNRSTP